MANPRPVAVLIVDDDGEIGRMAADMLRDGGCTTWRAENALEAMNILKEQPQIDILFTDLVMPGIDGIKLADMSKQMFPRLKVLYTTGHRQVADTLPGILHGDTLLKPYGAVELCRAIRHAMTVRMKSY